MPSQELKWFIQYVFNDNMGPFCSTSSDLLHAYVTLMPNPLPASDVRIYASVNWVGTDSGNGVPPAWRQSIMRTSADIVNDEMFFKKRNMYL